MLNTGKTVLYHQPTENAQCTMAPLNFPPSSRGMLHKSCISSARMEAVDLMEEFMRKSMDLWGGDLGLSCRNPLLDNQHPETMTKGLHKAL